MGGGKREKREESRIGILQSTMAPSYADVMLSWWFVGLGGLVVHMFAGILALIMGHVDGGGLLQLYPQRQTLNAPVIDCRDDTRFSPDWYQSLAAFTYRFYLISPRVILTAWGAVTLLCGAFIFGQSTTIAVMQIMGKIWLLLPPPSPITRTDPVIFHTVT